MIKRLLPFLFLFAFVTESYASCPSPVGQVYTVTTEAEMISCFAVATTDGDKIHIGANFSLTTQSTWVVPDHSEFYGDGRLVTEISDEYTSQNSPFLLTITGTKHFRLHDIEFKGGTIGGTPAQYSKYSGIIQVYSDSSNIIFDHWGTDTTTYTTAETSAGIRVIGCSGGVISNYVWVTTYRSTTNAVQGYNGGFCNSDALTVGDQVWTLPPYFGSAGLTHSLIVENSSFTNGAGNDCTFGGSMVIRFSTFSGSQGPPQTQTHPTVDRIRGCRMLEMYQNQYITQDGEYDSDAHWMSSGTGLIWGNFANSSSAGGSTGIRNFVRLIEMRANNATYDQSAAPSKWGYCGPTTQLGTVSAAASGANTVLTKLTGSNFNSSWPVTTTGLIGGDNKGPGTMIILDAGTNNYSFHLLSVDSTTQITVYWPYGAFTSAGTSYALGSNFDGNSDTLTGYPCGDQPGRGEGDLLVNDFPSVVNNATGKDYTDPGFNPRQVSNPIYVWLNDYNLPPNNPAAVVAPGPAGLFAENRDYYLDVTNGECPSLCNQDTTASFDGTVGIGRGLRSARPATCTIGVTYWSTDIGSWNGLTNSHYLNQGVLDKCTGTNTWTNGWYTPLDFPHPLLAETPSASITSLTPSSGAQGATSLSVAVVGSNSNFVNATTVCDFGANITINSCTVSSATALTANITIAGGAAVGVRDATFTTGDEVVTSTGGFTVSVAATGGGVRINLRLKGGPF